MKKHNFSAGPCILPPSVLEQASKAVLELDQSGLSLIEMSHRGKEFVAVMDKARELVRELLHVPTDYSVLFLQGGASLQFVMTPYNFLSPTGKAAYLDTGVWSGKAIKEAQRLGEVDVVASSKDKRHNYIPTSYEVPSTSDYFHITSNNTIYGTQIKDFPKVEVPLICDMSSDIFSRQVKVEDFTMIYAGAQKNMGPAGATLVIVKNDVLGKTGRNIPAYLDYQMHIDNDSMFNTPPVFSIYTSMLMLEWLKDKGGVSAIEKYNEEKAQMLYDEIDRNPLFEGLADKAYRSTMNVTFALKDDQYEEVFNQLWQEAKVSGIKGHRSAGGYRASIYNAMTKESIQALIDVMKTLESKA